MCCIALAAMAISARDVRAEPCYAKGVKKCYAEVKRVGKTSSNDELERLRTSYELLCESHDDAEACVKLAIVRYRGIGGEKDATFGDVAAWLACEIDRTSCEPVGRALKRGRWLRRNSALGEELIGEAERVAEGRPFEPDGWPMAEPNASADGADEVDGSEPFGEVLDIHLLGDYEHQCDRGRAGACVKAAVMTEQGVGGKSDPSKAYELFWVACELDRTVCIDIAHAYASGEKVKRDKKSAKKFRRVALQREGEDGCRYGATDRCVTNGYAFLNGDHVERDREYAVALFEEACRAGDADGCAGLAAAYWSKPKGSKNRARAVKLYRKACDNKSATACWKLGRLYFRGQQVKQDTKRAEKLFQRACDLGDQAGCEYVKTRP